VLVSQVFTIEQWSAFAGKRALNYAGMSTFTAHWIIIYEGESNENFKYFLSRNLLNTKGTQ